MSILSTLTREQRDAVIGAVCPWCAHKVSLGCITTATGADWYHYIDGQKFDCKAHPLRELIYNADRAAERDAEWAENIA